MEAVCIRIYQDMVNYKKPFSLQIKESYPLPPYSTVIGMVHKMCGYDTYEPMKVSVQGKHHSRLYDYSIRYEFGNSPFEAGRHNVCVNTKNGDKLGIVRGTSHTELLVDIELLIHIVPDDQKQVEIIFDAFRYPKEYPALGRHEDIVRIDEVEKVNLNNQKIEESMGLTYDAYVPVNQKEDNIHTNATIYDLHKTYKIEDGIRKWENVKAYHVPSKTDNIFPGFWKDEFVLVDGKQHYVFLA